MNPTTHALARAAPSSTLREADMKPGPFTTEGDRWNAVVARRREADGAFFYGVTTTGVFCRPSCASRPPLRKNVAFFPTTTTAEKAGFRACKRCTPNERDPRDAMSERIVRACRLLEGDDDVRARDVAEAVGMSAFHFQRVFKKHVGVTPRAYRRRVVAERAKEELAGGASVTRAIYDAGYSSSSRFYEQAGREMGMRPRSARFGADGERVRFVTRRCSLGVVLVAWTDAGVCDVRFDDARGGAVEGVRQRFPKARLERASVPAWVDAIVLAVDKPRTLDLPLDIEGTAFQERVWSELRAIPVGDTRTYRQVAEAIGNPRGSRAVARACATNRIALAIPCHRVVHGSGGKSGYRWGVARKKALLAREAEEG